MRLLKQHKLYPECMSETLVVYQDKKRMYDIQEYYGSEKKDKLHYLSFRKWVKSDSAYVLRKWYHLPLNKYTQLLFKQDEDVINNKRGD